MPRDLSVKRTLIGGRSHVAPPLRPLPHARRDAPIEDIFRHAPQPRVRRRANAVRLSSRGCTVREIAEVIGCTRQTVRNCFEHFESGGCEALRDKPRSGRPPVATPDYRAQLVEAVKTSPEKLGYPFTVWSVARLRVHMAREMDVLISRTCVRQITKEEGLVFKRPKHTLKGKRDEDAFAAVRDVPGAVQESHWNPIPAWSFCIRTSPRSTFTRTSSGRCSPKGEIVEIPAPGSNRKLPIYGALNYRTNHVSHRVGSGKNSRNFRCVSGATCGRVSRSALRPRARQRELPYGDRRRAVSARNNRYLRGGLARAPPS